MTHLKKVNHSKLGAEIAVVRAEENRHESIIQFYLYPNFQSCCSCPEALELYAIRDALHSETT